MADAERGTGGRRPLAETTAQGAEDTYARAVEEWMRCHRGVLECTRQLAAQREKRQKVAEYLLRYPDRLRARDPLKAVERNRYTPLTFAFVQKCLHECIEDKDATAQLLAYLKSRRECVQVKDIVVKPNARS